MGPACVVGLGVDTEIFRPVDIQEARRRVLPPEIREGFIVGNVNRNQPRKRMDLSVSYFAEWIKEYDIRDAYLYLHLAPTGDKGWDVKQLAKYYGIQNRLITPKNIPLGIGVPIEHLAMVMNAFDIGINTGWGEGFGLTTLEMMACGKPVIVGDWSAHAEWATTAIRVPCTSTMTMWNDVNTIGGIPDRTQFVKAMNEMYENGALRRKIGADSFALSRKPQFQWSEVGMAFSEAVDAAMIGAEIEPLEAMLPEREPIS
jgi:glycosyltransferase involved in cell wall biosynthesis